MKLILTLLFTVMMARQLLAETFNVNFDSTRTPQISGPGGTLPPPPGLPAVSTLDPSAGNSVHSSGSSSPLWIDSYQSGDYFFFDLTELNPANQIVFNGIWFGVSSGPQGPERFAVEMWSAGVLVGSQEASDAGVYVWDFTWTSLDHTAQIRVVGMDGVNDVGAGPFETYGVDFISASFTVVPEPSSLVLTLGALAGVAAVIRRNSVQ